MKLRRQAAQRPGAHRRLLWLLLTVAPLALGYTLVGRRMGQRQAGQASAAAAPSGGGGSGAGGGSGLPPPVLTASDSSSSHAATAAAADADAKAEAAAAAAAAVPDDAPAAAGPKTVCSDTCPGHASDGICDEGRPNVTAGAGAQQTGSPVQAVHCDLGTDCSDCGPWVR